MYFYIAHEHLGARCYVLHCKCKSSFVNTKRKQEKNSDKKDIYIVCE